MSESNGKPRGWFRLPNEAIGIVSTHGAMAFAVLSYLAMRADGKGESFPSVETIAKDLGTSRRTVMRCVSVLRTNGYISTNRRRRDVSLYTVVRSATHGTSKNQEVPKTTHRGDTSGTGECHQCHTEQDPRNKTQGTKQRESGKAAPPSDDLLSLIDGWNTLGPSIVKPGNGSKRDPVSKAILQGWARVQRDTEAREAFQDVPALLAACSRAKFCHRKDWFALAWLFGKNKVGQWNAVKVLNGQHDDSDAKTNGRARYVDAALHPDQPDNWAGA